MATEDLPKVDGHPYVAIYRDDEHRCTSYEAFGPKAYYRVWDNGAREWGWVLNDAAYLIERVAN